jgi:hypothetical protein
MTESHTLAHWQEASQRQGETIRRLVETLTDIRDVCGETHTGQERAYTALSRIDQIARKALTP